VPTALTARASRQWLAAILPAVSILCSRDIDQAPPALRPSNGPPGGFHVSECELHRFDDRLESPFCYCLDEGPVVALILVAVLHANSQIASSKLVFEPM